MSHLQLLADAKAAIQRVISDTSVSKATTVESLEELRDEIEEQIDAIKLTTEDDDELEADI